MRNRNLWDSTQWLLTVAHHFRFPFRFPFYRYVCQEHWSSPLYNYYYTIALLVLQFVLPLVVLIFTYSRIAFAVWGKKPPGEAENSRDQRMAKSKRKVCQYSIVITRIWSDGSDGQTVHLLDGIYLD